MSYLPRRFHVVHTAPGALSMQERVLLYALVAGLQPERVLELGGDATLIVCAALDDLEAGRIVRVGAQPEDWDAVRHRTTLAGDLAEVDGPFGLALVADVRDLPAALPRLADVAHVVLRGDGADDRRLTDVGILAGGLRLLRFSGNGP
jgi:hypothetical protein